MLRASDSDRERVLDILKTAFVQGRLTKEELDLRVGKTLGSRTWGELTAVTADIPAWPLPYQVRRPARTPSSAPMNAVIKAVACAIIALAAITLAGMPGMWTMAPPPTATAQACQTFHSWQSQANRNDAMLNFAVAVAGTGSDQYLAHDLATLQQASNRYEDIAGQPQSVAAMQAESNQLQADVSQVTADCQSDGY